MATLTFDSQSFVLDGRRVWIVSGSLHYARTPRATWLDRIRAARQAGLNTIATPIVWARHEPRPGAFDFTGDNDLRHFVELVRDAGMWCILRPGPFVGGGYDLGGMPPWLLGLPGAELRTANGPFLEACSRYLTAVSHQVRDLQVTSAGAGGPILLIQNEHGWTCGDDALGSAYLGELARYHRESGMTAALVNCNNLWQGVEGEIDGWGGTSNLLSMLRQLATVRPQQPRIVVSFTSSRLARWGDPAARAKPEADDLMVRRLAQTLAAGAQFNLDPFHCGTSFGFEGGRAPETPEGYYATGIAPDAPLDELGRPTPLYHAVRRVCMFASSFARLFANLEAKRQHATIDPAVGQSGTGTLSVTHVTGSQGGVAFVFPPFVDGQKPGPRSATLVLQNGLQLPFDAGDLPVAWAVFDARLTARATLDWSNLSAFALVGQVLVVFGPAGAAGRLSINGSPLDVEVPRGGLPLVIEHEGIQVVIANAEQLGSVVVTEEAVYLGIGGLTRAGEVIPHEEHRSYIRLTGGGSVSSHRVAAPGAAKTGKKKRTSKAAPARASSGPSKVRLGEWEWAGAGDYTSGQSQRYAAIDGPAELGVLGSPYGYGWYRVRFRAGSAKKARAFLPHGGDRLHMILDGEPLGVVGFGPGAMREWSIPLKRRDMTLVALAENFGRFAGGDQRLTGAGFASHLWSVKPIKTAKPAVQTGAPIRALSVRKPLWNVHNDDMTDHDRLTWSFLHRRKSPVFITLGAFEGRGALIVNDRPLWFFDRGGAGCITLDEGVLNRGKNIVQIALLGTGTADRAGELAAALSLHEGEANLTERAEWAFAKWEPPPPDSFGPARNGGKSADPAWWRSSFKVDAGDGPLVFDATGLSKGQLYVNGRHLSRYFVATADGVALGTQSQYHVPRAWVEPDEPNELMVFDEHGGSPAKCTLVSA